MQNALEIRLRQVRQQLNETLRTKIEERRSRLISEIAALQHELADTKPPQWLNFSVESREKAKAIEVRRNELETQIAFKQTELQHLEIDVAAKEEEITFLEAVIALLPQAIENPDDEQIWSQWLALGELLERMPAETKELFPSPETAPSVEQQPDSAPETSPEVETTQTSVEAESHGYHFLSKKEYLNQINQIVNLFKLKADLGGYVTRRDIANILGLPAELSSRQKSTINNRFTQTRAVLLEQGYVVETLKTRGKSSGLIAHYRIMPVASPQEIGQKEREEKHQKVKVLGRRIIVGEHDVEMTPEEASVFWAIYQNNNKASAVNLGKHYESDFLSDALSLSSKLSGLLDIEVIGASTQATVILHDNIKVEYTPVYEIQLSRLEAISYLVNNWNTANKESFLSIMGPTHGRRKKPYPMTVVQASLAIFNTLRELSKREKNNTLTSTQLALWEQVKKQASLFGATKLTHIVLVFKNHIDQLPSTERVETNDQQIASSEPEVATLQPEALSFDIPTRSEIIILAAGIYFYQDNLAQLFSQDILNQELFMTLTKLDDDESVIIDSRTHNPSAIREKAIKKIQALIDSPHFTDILGQLDNDPQTKALAEFVFRCWEFHEEVTVNMRYEGQREIITGLECIKRIITQPKLAAEMHKIFRVIQNVRYTQSMPAVTQEVEPTSPTVIDEQPELSMTARQPVLTEQPASPEVETPSTNQLQDDVLIVYDNTQAQAKKIEALKRKFPDLESDIVDVIKNLAQTGLFEGNPNALLLQSLINQYYQGLKQTFVDGILERRLLNPGRNKKNFPIFSRVEVVALLWMDLNKKGAGYNPKDINLLMKIIETKING